MSSELSQRKNTRSTTNSSQTGGTANSSQTGGTTCSECKKSQRSGKFINCAGPCGGLFDLTCADVSIRSYEEVFCKKSKVNSVNWYCKKCTAKNANMNNTCCTEEMIQQLLNKALNGFLENLDGKIEKLVSAKIKEFGDSHDVAFNEFEAKIQALEERVAQLELLPKNEPSGDILSAIDQSCERRVKEIIAETNSTNDKQDRLNNLLIHGVPNDAASNVKDIMVKAFTKYNSTFNADNVTCYRLTKRGETPVTSPILCKFRDKRDRDGIFFKYLAKRDLVLSDVVDGAAITSRVFINEHLNKDEAMVIKRCRDMRKEWRHLRIEIVGQKGRQAN